MSATEREAPATPEGPRPRNPLLEAHRFLRRGPIGAEGWSHREEREELLGARGLAAAGPPSELVGLEPFAPPEVMPVREAHA